MSAKFYTLLTDIGAAKLASAAALGVPLKITHMAVGSGGGVLPTPNAQQTALVAEERRAALNMLYIDPQNSSQIIAEQVIPENEGGWWIREVGLFDETGALIAVGNCPESYKPKLAEGSGRTQTVRMVLITSSTDNITLKIDPAVVLATRKYVDDKVLELKVYVDDLMAKHLAAVDPHSQYAPKDSPTLTGMPKTPTPPAGNNSTLIASTAFVQAAILTLIGGAPATLDTLKEIAAAINNDPNFSTTINNALALKAPLASPALTGAPTAPTAVQSTNNTQIATTAFVKSAVAGLVGSSPEALDTLNELAAALGNDPNFATTVMNALAGKQPLDATLTNLSGKSISGLLEYLRIVDATTSQKGLVRLNGGVTDESNKEAATPGAVKIAYDAAMNAFNLAKTKYTAEGATTAIAGLVQLVNSMGGSNALVMPQAAVTTAIQTYPSLGKGQTLQDLRTSRGVGVTYTNSTGFPIAVYVRITGGTSANLYAYVDGKEYGGGGATASQTSIATAFFIVPNNTNYRVDAAGVSTVLQAWTELR
ncbi:phage tail protein [Citrobacter sp. A316]|uniref:phage tail-collar fiber domain-containing protein n=1 Tax=Citrobacter sp. A316 TaxID=1639132 RepID=UPI0009ABB796|nr:phage tail protein [Citrobacter sp. A316]